MPDARSPHPATPTPRSRFGRIMGIAIGTAMWPAFILAFGSAPACMGFESVTLRAIEVCPAATELLGTPVTRSMFGLSCGNAEAEGNFGHASWTFPVTGPRGRGSVSVVAQQNGGPWQLLSASLESGAGHVDVVRCVAGGSARVTPVSVDATAVVVIGNAGVVQGSRCQIAVSPGEDPQPCRVVIDCGGAVLYGAGTTGWSGCGREPDGSLRVRDTSPSPSGGDPTLDLQLGLGTAVLTDESASGTWVVQLSFTPSR